MSSSSRNSRKVSFGLTRRDDRSVRCVTESRPVQCHASEERKRRGDEGGPRFDAGVTPPKRRRTTDRNGGSSWGGKERKEIDEALKYKALEDICETEPPEDGILELINKSERFEALLKSQEIRTDLMKLVIRALHRCSSPNDVQEHADKMLRLVKKTHFLSIPLSRFINGMPQDRKLRDEGDLFHVISWLADVFLALIQRYGMDIVRDIPLPQLNASLCELKNRKRITTYASDLERKLEQVRELREEVIRRANPSYDYEDESQLEPPQDFREISVIPQAADLSIGYRPFLRANVTDRKYKNLDHYLDVQFRLLREDFIIPLRDGIKQLKNELESLGRGSSRNSKRAKSDAPVYHDVTILYPVCSGKGMVYRIRFNSFHWSVRRVQWNKSKRLKFGSLVCLSADDFYTPLFATVENRDVKELCLGELDVRFEGVEPEQVNAYIEGREKFAMVESPSFFEAYRHTLEALKGFEPDDLPFQEHIVECRRNVAAPGYLTRSNCIYDMSVMVEEGVIESSGLHLNDGKLEGRHSASVSNANKRVQEQDRYSDPDDSKRVPDDMASYSDDDRDSVSEDRKRASDDRALYSDDRSWVADGRDSVSEDMDLTFEESSRVSEDFDSVSSDGPVISDGKLFLNVRHLKEYGELLGFNASQMRAFELALTKKFAVIQGPPGTGKTYVGLKIAHALLHNASVWQEEERSPMLMVSYTNHALDQFLEGLLPMEGIVRVGGRSKSEKLKSSKLKWQREVRRESRETPRRITRAKQKARKDMEKLNDSGSIEVSALLLKSCRRGIISFDVLKQFIRDRHVEWFEREDAKSLDDVLCHWLGVERIPSRKDSKERHDRSTDRDEDFRMQFSVRNFVNEDDDEKGHETSSRNVVVCSIEETKRPEELRRKLQDEESMNDDEEKGARNLWHLSPWQRWRLYRLWLQRVEKHYLGLLQTTQPDYERAQARLNELVLQEDFLVLQKARVIGMTTTCAAKYRRTLQRINPKIVLVEEAAEVLEAHIVTSLTKGCQHLILIGDHQQLRPNPAVFELAQKYKLDVSLFERMMKVGIECERLSVQHRMRPEIAALMKHIYKDLHDHESVESYEDIKGMKKNMFFINHSHLEDSCDDSHSHVNQHEASFVVALCGYLLQQGYNNDQISLLTTYTGQMFAIRDCMGNGNEQLQKVRLTTVDNFQGEESDIIILSLVRSNKNEKIGFIKTVNRACVALSRAKEGFYCIGNFSLLSRHSDIWRRIVADLKASGSIGESLPLVCQIHRQEVSLKTAEEFKDKVPYGGCQRPCEVRLECGHVCRKLCHPSDIEHQEYKCIEPCARNIKGCAHMCPNHCWQKCESECREVVERTLPMCGHTAKMSCGKDVNRVECRERCRKIILSCGHRCQGRCGKPCTKKCQELVKRWIGPCGHDVTIACSAASEECPVPCRTTLECGHQCSGQCGECRMGRVHKRCKKRCGRIMVCSHECKEWCTVSCPPCSKRCENRCVHSKCDKSCGEPCVPCREKCSWKCHHHACSKLCGELCDRPRCNEPCQKIIVCGRNRRHLCRGLCGEQCICAVCQKNDNDQPITEIFLGGEEDEDALFIQLPDCKHIFAVSDLDRYMDMSQDDTADGHMIQLKSCPRCKTAIRRSLRYGNVVKQQLQDIEKVKNKEFGDWKKVDEKKTKLVARLASLKTSLGETEMKDWEQLERRVKRMSEGIMAALAENQVTLLERYCTMNNKLKTDLLSKTWEEVSADKRLEGRRVESQIEYLRKRFMSDGVTQRELRDINTEFTRLSVQLELSLLKHNVQSLKLTLKNSSRQEMTAVQNELSSGKLMEEKKMGELLEKLAKIRRAYPSLSPMTPEEQKQIVSAMGFSKGHWFKCPQGHVYAVGECGGAMQRATCPECGAVIGGANHRLEEGNTLASEMDGARHAAWSEQANLENYIILEEI